MPPPSPDSSRARRHRWSWAARPTVPPLRGRLAANALRRVREQSLPGRAADGSAHLHAAAFSVVGDDAFPDVVAFFDRESRHHHVLVARISEDGGGAGGWESYRLYLSTGGFGSFRYGTVVGDEVWYVDGLGKAVALDLIRHDGDHWRVLCADGWGRRNRGGGRQFFLVADTTESGEPTVVRVHCPPPCYMEFRFSRLDEQRGEWVPLTDGELEGTSWFLAQRCFVVRGVDGAKKVYLLSPDDEKREGRGGATRVLRPLPAVRHGNVYVHDLDAATSEPLFTEPFLTTGQSWVHPDYFLSFLNHIQYYSVY